MTFESAREKLAWAAGIFEGEGCLGFYKKGSMINGGVPQADVARQFDCSRAYVSYVNKSMMRQETA